MPGGYRVRITADGAVDEATFEVLKDRRLVDIPVADLQQQFDFLTEAGVSMNRLQAAFARADSTRRTVSSVVDSLGTAHADAEWLPGARARADSVVAGLDRVADALVQTEGGGWDREAKLRRQLSFILNESQTQRGEYTDARPTDQWVERLGDVALELEEWIVELERVISGELARLNDYLRDNGVGVRIISD